MSPTANAELLPAVAEVPMHEAAFRAMHTADRVPADVGDVVLSACDSRGRSRAERGRRSRCDEGSGAECGQQSRGDHRCAQAVVPLVRPPKLVASHEAAQGIDCSPTRAADLGAQMRNGFAFGKRERFPFCRAGSQHPRPPATRLLRRAGERGDRMASDVMGLARAVRRPHERRSRIRCGQRCHRDNGRPTPMRPSPGTSNPPPERSSNARWASPFGAMPASIPPAKRQTMLRLHTVRRLPVPWAATPAPAA